MTDLPSEIDLGWHRKPGFAARLVWHARTDVLYVIRYVSGPTNTTVAFELPIGGCHLDDLPAISAEWAERGPEYILDLSAYLRPTTRFRGETVDPPAPGTLD